MTETKPTPGPWYIDGEDAEAGEIPIIVIARGPCPSPEYKDIAHVTCTIEDEGHGDFVLTDEDWANAHLMAAALDLLEALKECVDEMSQHIYPKPDVPDDHPYRKLQRAQAAIAKAEGRDDG